MVFAIQYRNSVSSFYTAPANEGKGFTCFFLYAPSAPDRLSLTECFNEPQYKGYFIFLAAAPAIKALVDDLQQWLSPKPEHTQLVWINAALAGKFGLTLLSLNSEGIQQEDVHGAWGKYGISIPGGSKVITDTRDGISGLSWTTPVEGVSPQPQPFFLPFSGNYRGLLSTRASISDFSDTPGTGWDVGFRYFMPVNAEVVSQYYPLFHPEKNTNILFKFYWDFTSSQRTQLEFEAGAFILEPAPDQPGGYRLQLPAKPELLRTWLRTDMGLPVYMNPLSDALTAGQGAKLVLSPLPGGDYYWTPDGSFELLLEKEPLTPTSFYLLCGLSGAETMSFQPRSHGASGDVLRFESGKPAYVYNFPNAPAAEKIIPKKKGVPQAPSDLYIVHSKARAEEQRNNATHLVPVSGPSGPDASSYLNDTYQTSWMKLRQYSATKGVTGYYFAQPSASPLYGGATGFTPYPPPGQTESAYSFMPFFRPPSAVLNSVNQPTDINFPIAPVAGASSNPAAQKINPGLKSPAAFLSFFEEQVMLPARSEQVMKKQPKPKRQLKAAAADTSTYSTSPQGLLVEIGETNFKWKKLLFAYTPADKDIPGSVKGELYFESLGDQLQKAFQKNQMFLVLSVLPASDAKSFKNEISIQGWPFKLAIPESIQGNDYKNILIFKFTKGAIKELAQKPAEWTSATDFNKDPAAVSEWLGDYFNREEPTLPRKSRYNDQASLYTHFNEIINSENWTGILSLNVDINLNDFPEQIKGLVGGIDLDKFRAHHFGVEVNQVVPDEEKGGLKFAEPSSLFGLIDYKGIESTPNMPFDFKVDLLQVHFLNNTITDFRCNISLTLGSLFGELVNITPEPPQPSTIGLTGTYEKHGTVATYSFLSDQSYTLSSIQGSVWKTIAISKIQFFTLSQQNDMVNSVFSFWGDMAFNNVGIKENFDLFSFDQLAFSGMQLLMNFTIPAKPAGRVPLTFAFDPSAITFNNSTSQARTASLFQNFPLDAKGMVSGNEKNLPAGKGYYPVELPMGAAEIKGTWYALRYDLDLGTPGALAEKAGFTASILACWTPENDTSQTQIAAFLQLPGGGGLFQTVLQNVLTLSVGDARFSSQPGTTGNPVYKLALEKIALKVLGFTIPPGGDTYASLFTNEDQEGKKDSTGWYIAYNKK